jgi:hypothetical protein
VASELVEESDRYTGTPPMIPPINTRKGGGGMNKWNRLLAMLDQVFGFENKLKSTFKKVSQDFDEKTNEHVFVIEYRIRVGQRKKQVGTPVQQKPVEQKSVAKKPVQNEPAKSERYPLLHDVNDRIALPPYIE